jgi:hypothetical protein
MNKVNVDRIFEAITSINPNAEITINGEDLDTIVWVVGNPISKSDIEAKIAELKTAYDAKQYQRDRVYPSIGDQLDMQYKDLLNGTTTWKDAVAKVKSDNPKG